MMVLMDKITTYFLKNKGFTLIETLISITVLSILLLSFLSFFYQSGRIENSNQHQLVAINLAESTLERVKNDGFEQVDGPGTYNLTPCDDETADCAPIINGERYEIAITIAPANDFALNLATIQVSLENDSQVLASLEGYVNP